MDFYPTTRRNELRQLQYFDMKSLEKKVKKDWKQLCREYLGYDPDLCPCGGKAEMVTIERRLPGRSLPINVLYLQVVNAT